MFPRLKPKHEDSQYTRILSSVLVDSEQVYQSFKLLVDFEHDFRTYFINLICHLYCGFDELFSNRSGNNFFKASGLLTAQPGIYYGTLAKIVNSKNH